MAPMNDTALLRHSRVDYSAYVDKEAAGHAKYPFGPRQALISLAAFFVIFTALAAA